MNASAARLILLTLVILLLPTALAQYRLPEGTFTIEPGALQIHSPHYTDTYIFGLGWASGADIPDPFVVGQAVSVSAELLALVNGEAEQPAAREPVGFSEVEPATPPAFTPTPLPGGAVPADPATSDPVVARISDVRFGGSHEVRVVFDIPDLSSTSRLLPLISRGENAAGQPLVIPLSGLSAPASPLYADRGVRVQFGAAEVSITTSGAPYSFNVFAVADPVRLVIDLVPLSGSFAPAAVETVLADPVPVTGSHSRQLASGITLEEFRYPTGQGSSAVQVLRIAPGAGRFEVVGSSRSGATLSELARGSLAAINAGYFNTSTFEHIGLLMVNGELDGLPSLGRASIGFAGDQVRIARTSAEVHVLIDGHTRVMAPAGRLGIELFHDAGQSAGDASRGVLLLSGGRVTANRVGPLVVPPGGLAIAYAPELRQLALLEPGSQVSHQVVFTPQYFNTAANAVEAGPLLVDSGQAAFQPEVETFQRGQRILDDFTSQAAIGVTAEGAVLMVVADNMRAQDLVPLFLSLGAEQAMRLDSGGSATLYAAGEVLNRSVQRRIVSAIVLRPF